MISKRYYDVINFGTVSNFYISVDPVCPGPLERHLQSISTIPVHFIHIHMKVSKYNFVFITLTFVFQIILQSFKETPFNQLLSSAMP